MPGRRRPPGWIRSPAWSLWPPRSWIGDGFGHHRVAWVRGVGVGGQVEAEQLPHLAPRQAYGLGVADQRYLTPQLRELQAELPGPPLLAPPPGDEPQLGDGFVRAQVPPVP